jgi:hypothetical protein
MVSLRVQHMTTSERRQSPGRGLNFPPIVALSFFQVNLFIYPTTSFNVAHWRANGRHRHRQLRELERQRGLDYLMKMKSAPHFALSFTDSVQVAASSGRHPQINSPSIICTATGMRMAMGLSALDDALTPSPSPSILRLRHRHRHLVIPLLSWPLWIVG